MDVLNNLWSHIFFEKLQINPKDHPLMIIEPTSRRRPHQIQHHNEDCQSLQDLAFNTFGFPKVAFVETAEMALLGSTARDQPDRKDGIVVDLGHRGRRIDLVRDGQVDVVYSLTHVSTYVC